MSLISYLLKQQLLSAIACDHAAGGAPDRTSRSPQLPRLLMCVRQQRRNRLSHHSLRL